MRALWIEDHALIGESLDMLLRVVMPELTLDKARDWALGERLFSAIPYELVLLDWWLGDGDAEAAIDRIRALRPGTPFLVVSGDERAGLRERALARGAAGFVSKAAEPQDLVAAIRTALQAKSTSNDGDVPPAPDRPPQRDVPRVDVAAVYPELTQRQCDVFRGMMRALGDKAIARELGIGETTVKTHVRAILQALGVHRRGEAVIAARARGADVL